ncbi:MAG TPA: carboxypeptidase regulatory-like domain-containing protein, partial [Vicinamibacterales bacterium]|nr:carboxypeptidase regulatory-like domain-containing protein [Vicinamibacterales bacterium]
MSLVTACAFAVTAFAQVTTGSLNGKVQDAQQQGVAGASVIAIHLPSGTTYETTSRSDGRFVILNMRVGGPYSVTVAFTGTGAAAFAPETQENVEINLGVATDLTFNVKPISVTETVTVTAESSAVFSSARTGAATSVNRETLATLPTVSGRIADFTRLTPQTSGANSFGGADNRMNNMTINGAAFNNSFGLGGQPGERTGVAPISLEAIEQVQVSIAPYDVRQGNFVGAAVDTVTRAGTNSLRAATYYRFRNDSFVGTEARGNAFNPGTFDTKQQGVWAGAPIVKNKLFVFGNFENEKDARPLYSFRANSGGETVGGNVTRVLASDMTNLANFLKTSFNYDPGSFDPATDNTPQKRGILRLDYNLNASNKIFFNYVQLNSSSDNQLSGSTSAGIGRRQVTTDFMQYQGSNYQILENRVTPSGEWNSVIGNAMANSFRVTYSSSDESRPQGDVLFPFVDILQGGSAYISFGSEPFTPNNELRYKSFEVKNDFTKFGNTHEFTGGFRVERYHSDNVFFNCCKQGSWVYSSLDDFYADARDALANPNRATSAVTIRKYQNRYMNLPGLDKPSQPLTAIYGGAYAQDVWRPRSNLSLTAGLRFDVPVFENTAYLNPNANALTFRDENGQPVQYDSGAMPGANILWSPRFGFNYDLSGDQRTQIRGGSGVFTGQPLYVWISNQLGNTGMLQGSLSADATLNQNTSIYPFSTNVDRYKPAATGQPATSYELDVTDKDFRFPQVWRSNIAVDRRLPGGITGTAEFMYNRDVNGIYYINANLPAAQTAYAGADTRPRWTNTRINNATGNQVTAAIVMKNQNIGRNWNLAFSASKPMWHGLSLRTAYSYGEAKNTIDPGSTANASWNSNATPGDPNNPGLGFSTSSPGHRFYLSASYTKQYFGFGATSISTFWESRTGNSATNSSYVFAADANGDGGAANDLIYIPRDRSEMNFQTFTVSGITFTADQQAEAFDAYIAQDKYLSQRRGQYAERNAVFLPFLHRMDLSLTQDVFKNIKGKRNAGQFRIDIQNFGNLLNSNWGVGQRIIRNNILTSPAVDAQGRLSYRMQVVNNQLVRTTFESTSGLADVYQFMLSFRYS